MLNVGGAIISEALGLRKVIVSLRAFRSVLFCFALIFALNACNENGATVDSLFQDFASQASTYSSSFSGNPILNNNAGGVGNQALIITGTPSLQGSSGYNFQSQTVGAQAVSIPIIVKNISSAYLFIDSIQARDSLGNLDQDFMITPDPDPVSRCPTGTTGLAPGGLCSFMMRFTPKEIGQAEFPMELRYGLNGLTYPFSATAIFTGRGVVKPTFSGLNPISESLVSTTRIGLTWPAAIQASTFAVYQCVEGAQPFQCAGEVVPSPSPSSGPAEVFPASGLTLSKFINDPTATGYTMTNLAPNTSYLFWVQALNDLSESDGNLVLRRVRTDTTGNFGAIPLLSATEGVVATSSDLANYCTDSRGHQPTYVSLLSQSDLAGNCSLLSSPYRIQCNPSFKAGHSSWSSTLTLSCLINDYPVPLIQTLSVSVADSNRAPVVLPISNATSLAGVPLQVSASALEPDGDGMSMDCRLDTTVDGVVSDSATNCTSLLNVDGSFASFNSLTGVLNWTPPLTYINRTFEFRISARDTYFATGSAVFNVFVQPPPPSHLRSTLSVASAALASGSNATVTLQAKDANGNTLSYGGASPVVISISSGATSGQLGPTVDQGNGTYTAVLTGRLVGSATLSASIQGNPIATALPTFTVIPGPVSVANSTFSVSSASIQSGAAATLTLIPRDAAGNRISSGGLSVGFGLATGTGLSSASIGPAALQADGSYQSTVTGVLAGTPAAVGASIGGNAVTSAAPSLTVTPGVFSLTHSSVLVSPAGTTTVTAGSSVDLTFVAKDAAGNQLQGGGLSVGFDASGGIGASTGSFGSVIDHSNGTYGVTFKGEHVGTPTQIVGRVGGSSTTSSVSIAVTPGIYSVATSIVTMDLSTLPSGTQSSVRLQLKDVEGNQTTSASPLAVVFYQTAGTSTVSMGSTTDHLDGTYSAPVTGVLAGGTGHLTARIGSTTLVSVQAAFTVTPGPISLSQSTLTSSSGVAGSIASGSSATLTLIAKDSAGNLLTSGGRSVVFSYSGGTSTGTISGTTDSSSGMYTATFEGVIAGSATTLSATIDGDPILSTTPTIQVQAGAISLSQSTVSPSSSSLAAGDTVTLTLTFRDLHGNRVLDSTQTSRLSLTLSALTAGLSRASFSAFTPVAGSEGVYQSVATATTAGTANSIQASLSGLGSFSNQPSWMVTPGALSVGASTLRASSVSVTADGVSTATLTVSLKDAYSNPKSGKTVSLVSSRGATDTITTSSNLSDANGQVTLTVKSTTTGSSTYSTSVSPDSASLIETVNLSFTPGPVVLVNSSVVSSDASPLANNSDFVTVAVTLKDANLNGVSGKTVGLTSNRSGYDTIAPSTSTTDNNGIALFRVKSTLSGTSTYTALNSTDSMTVGSVGVTFASAPISPSVSTVVSNLSTVEADGVLQAIVSVTVKDALSNGLAGKTVALTSDQSDTISPASVTTNSSGVATFTVSSTTVHTSVLTATADSLVLSTQPTLSFTARVPNLAQSTLGLSATSLFKNGTSTATLTVKNARGVSINSGGLTVAFAASTGVGVSTGAFGAITDHGNGTYTSVFTATGKGTASTVTATITGYSGTVTAASTLTVQNTPPVMVPSPTHLLYLAGPYSFPTNSNSYLPLVQGTSYTLAAATDADGDSVTFSCTYSTPGLQSTDPNYKASGTNCSTLPSLVTTNGVVRVGTVSLSASSVTWAPTTTQRGTYQLVLTPTDGTTPGAVSTLFVTVRENDTLSNLLYGLDAQFATNGTGLGSTVPSGTFASGTVGANWLNLFNGGTGQTLNACTWSGTGTGGSPYSLSFDGSTSTLNTGSQIVNSSTKFAIETWVKPSTPFAFGTVIAGNGGSSGNGFVIRQAASPGPSGRAEFVVGKKYYSYSDLISSQTPTAYWRLGETSGTTINDSSGNNYQGTFSGSTSPTLGITGALGFDSNQAIGGGSSGARVSLGYPTALNFTGNQSFSVSFWARTNTTGTPYFSIGTAGDGGVGALNVPGWRVRSNFGTIHTSSAWGQVMLDRYDGTASYGAGQSYRWNICGGTACASVLGNNSWHHYVVVYYNGTGATNCGTAGTPAACFYMDGSNSFTQLLAGANLSIPANNNPLVMSMTSGAAGATTNLDEVAVFNAVLSASQVTQQYTYGKGGSFPGNAILADQPVGYWRLNETSGSIAYDYSGNNLNLSYATPFPSAAPSNLPVFGRSGPFSGSGDSTTGTLFTSRTSLSASPATTALANVSLETWIYPTANSTGWIAGLGLANSAGQGYGLWIGNSTGYTTAGLRPYMIWPGVAASMASADISVNTWNHLVMTSFGTSWTLYVNGAVAATGTRTPASAPTRTLVGASSSANNDGFVGVIAEFAVYRYGLSASQVSAHYNSGKGSGWWYCQSKSILSSANWSLLSATFDSVTGVSSLYYNGVPECSVTPSAVDASVTYSQPSSNVWLGTTPSPASSFWAGLIGSFKAFGTADNVIQPLPSSSIAADFAAEANRFRTTPVENSVTSGLVLNLDAANANQGMINYASGCASSTLSWWDFSGFWNHGTLTGFTGCTTTNGWQGAGTVASPYVLRFNGTTDRVGLSLSPTGASTSVTFSGWINVAAFPASNSVYPAVYNNKGSQAYCGTGWGLYTTNNNRLLLVGGSCSTQASVSVSPNTWMHVAATITGTTGTIYVNGSVGTAAQYPNPNSIDAVNVNTSGTAFLGYNANTNAFFNGSVALAQIYNTALTQQQIKQNCLAQEARFTATPGTGSLCAAP